MEQLHEQLRIRNKGIRRVRVADLEDAPWNFRTHPAEQEKALAGAIEELGFYGYPDVYETNSGMLRICDGHLRKELLIKQYGVDAEIEVNITDFDEAEAKKATLTKDPLAAMAESDPAKLDALLQEIGTDSEALRAMLDELGKNSGLNIQPEIVEDEVPDVPDDPITKPGDLWILGEHRLLCGDSTKVEDVERLMDGETASLMATDPPYGIGYEYDQHKDETGDEYLALCDKWFAIGQSISDRQVVTTGWKYPTFWLDKSPSGQLVWFDDTKQSGHSIAHMRKTEPVFFFGKPLRYYTWDILQDRGVRGDGLRELHTCPKPVSLFAKLMDPQTDRGQIVYDPFLGSGTTLIAAEQLGRKCYAMEISPAYCDVAIARWENLTGKKAQILTPTASHA